MTSFGERLAEAMRLRGQLCVGIDPHPELLAAWGLPADADGLRAFCDVCVRALSGFAIVKPQVAFFEAYGAPGFAVLADTVTALRSAGVLVLADAKRGDIGSTMAAYATAWLGPSPLAADAVTASPYLGFGSLTPLLERADERDGGVFVLAATSNPEGATVQGAVVPGTVGDGRSVAQSVVDDVARCNQEAEGSLGSVGVVVGATLAEVPDLAEVRGPVLMPGIGAQGGRLDGLSGVGGAAREWLLPAVSREVLRAGPDAAAVRVAGERLRDEMARLPG